ncbi:MAG: ORF6N domain-containing protein [Nitrosomonadaceae bacterium]|nr:ORF6N domain-containing protein [Nitrosomonadaceae bacterium]
MEKLLVKVRGDDVICRMRDMVRFENLKELIIEIRGQSILLDSDVADLYGVETKRINEAVKNNPDKFPNGYIMELDKNEWDSLKSKFSTSIKGGKVKLPSAFTEKGLYMLATILKSPQATQATISIVETFSKIRDLSRSIKELSMAQDKADQKSLMKKSGELIAEIFNDDLQTSDTETSIELNFAVLKFKHTIKKKNK